MALVPLPQAGSALQIAATSQVSGTVLYTVPKGKTFTGALCSDNTTYGGYVTINGVSIHVRDSWGLAKIELVAGTIVVCSSNYTVSIVGIQR